MENQPSAGAAAFRKLANAGRLPQQALDRIVARCDMTLYDRQSPGHAADGGGREGGALRTCAAWNPAGIEVIVCGHGHVDHATGLPGPPSA